MKKFLALLTITMFVFTFNAPQASAQLQDQKITVKTSDLTVDQLAKIKLEEANAELQKKVDTYGKWVGVGGEIGTAVKDGLNAVVDVADKFGKTDVGRFTMIMIAWKVVGKDVVRIILGILFFITLTIIIVRVYRRVVMPRRVLIENPGLFKYPKKYQVVNPPVDGEDSVWITVILLLVFLAGIWITCGIMF